MRAPEFWGRSRPTVFARLLAPLGALYGAAAAWRMARDAPRADLPTIVIGGPTAGGDGKTPMALAIAEVLKRRGERPAFLTRGFARRPGAEREPFAVDEARHDARTAGDEALLLAQAAPTVVGVDRAAGAKLAARLGASVLILDDGLHSRRLAPDLAFGVIDSNYGLGNGLCLPAGPLRAPARDFLGLLDAIVVIGDGDATAGVGFTKQRFTARFAAEARDADRFRGRRVFAFSGIARPAKFERSLREAGGDVVGRRWFPDHHFFDETELSNMARNAARLGARLVTTQKDAARLSPEIIEGFSIETFSAALIFDDVSEIETFLIEALRRARIIRGV
jgi:tetraacyldisaccharide 4'-kinase